MKKVPLISAAVSSLSIAGSALAADMPVKAPNAPAPVPAFAWTSCYDGAHAGGGWAQTDVSNPVQVVQDSISVAPVTTGVTTGHLSPSGAVIGGQIGCDYQFAPNWGVEWAFSGNWSARLEYGYYQFDHGNVLMSDSLNILSGVVDVRQSVQAVKVGLNFHLWGGQ